jgi:hypothetical protein
MLERPVLRGWIRAVSTPLALAATIALLESGRPELNSQRSRSGSRVAWSGWIA